MPRLNAQGGPGRTGSRKTDEQAQAGARQKNDVTTHGRKPQKIQGGDARNVTELGPAEIGVETVGRLF